MLSLEKEKILLCLLPLWTPLIPPQGIGRIKTYLQGHGYTVKTADANTKENLQELFNEYFELLKLHIPEEKRGNYYNIRNDVMRDHFMAHINYVDESQYVELVKEIVYSTFFCRLEDAVIYQLKAIVDEYFTQLEIYLRDLLAEEQPEVFGVSVYGDTLPSALFAFRLVKAINPAIRTVMGGGIFTIQFPKDSPNLQYFLEKTEGVIDKLVIGGKGEVLFLKYLQGELPKEQRVYTNKDLPPEIANSMVETFADLSDVNVQLYPYQAGYMSSSCPFQCSFCNVIKFWGEHKKRDIKVAVEEMVKLYQTYGKQVFFMLDSLLNTTVNDLSNELIKSGYSLYWDGYLRVGKEVCDMENTRLWRRGGFYRARMGVESGSQHVLDMMGKGITIDETRGSLASLAYAGIKTTTYWVIGHPGETEEDFQQTLDLLEEMKNDIWEAECNPFGYFYSGQVNEDQWASQRRLLYPEWAKELLISQTWILDCQPTREETYSRINRFVQHCNSLGIPNPNSLRDIYLADERWKRLHKHAVPSLTELQGKGVYVEENKALKQCFLAEETNLDDDGDFDF